MRIHEMWPQGHGVDLDFWDDQDLWHLCDAAAIALGIDPRITYSSATDPAFQGGPKLAENQIPGLITKIENLCVMARNGMLPVLKDGVNDDAPMWWQVRPADFRAFIKKENNAASPELPQKSKASYLRIIAALCSASKIDWTKEGAASKITTKLEMIGEHVSPNTIRKILKEISEVVEAPER